MAGHKGHDDIFDGIEVISTNDISSRESRKKRKKQEQGQYDALKGFNILQKKFVITGLFILLCVVAFLLSFFFALDTGASPDWRKALIVIAVIALEIAMGFLLDHNPIWLHAIVAVLNIIVGLVFGQIVFMVIMMLVYVLGIASMEFVQRMNEKMKKRYAMQQEQAMEAEMAAMNMGGNMNGMNNMNNMNNMNGNMNNYNGFGKY